jgi:hypothetical protein
MEIEAEPKSEKKPKRVKVSQTNFPQLPITKSLGIIQTIWGQYGGDPTTPAEIAFAMKLVPTSGGWRNLTGTSIAYGLTEGGYSAKTIALAPIGRRIVAPTEAGDNVQALRDAVMKPNIMRQFYEKYNHKNFPEINVAENVLNTMGLPKDRTKSAVEILIANGLETGIMRETTTGVYYVALDASLPSSFVGKPGSETGLPPEIPGEVFTPGVGKQGKITFGKGLYVNFEIHIAADTPIDTIIAIFQNMKKYLIDNE